ncbi:MAG: hypothetical protein FJ267_20015 [Planctomycetes bacterium]|nr:hypothetical protein [Planctomycetota bacterium]
MRNTIEQDYQVFKKSEFKMGWSSKLLGSKSAELFLPDGDSEPVGLTVFLHGSDGRMLSESRVFTRELEKHKLACLCPVDRGSFWTDQIYPPFDELRSALDFLSEQIPIFLAERLPGTCPVVGLLGWEIGGQGVLQLAYRYPRKFPVVAAISPKVDYESWYSHGTPLDTIFPSKEAARQSTAVLQIHPLDWPKHQFLMCDPTDLYCFDGTVTLISKLNSTGIPHEVELEIVAGGYGWSFAEAMAIRAIEFVRSRMIDSPHLFQDLSQSII